MDQVEVSCQVCDKKFNRKPSDSSQSITNNVYRKSDHRWFDLKDIVDSDGKREVYNAHNLLVVLDKIEEKVPESLYSAYYDVY